MSLHQNEKIEINPSELKWNIFKYPEEENNSMM